MMNISQKGIDLIKNFEGLQLKSYKCPAGVWTIGYGTTRGVKQGQSITQKEAEELLKRDLRYFELRVDKLVTVPLTQGQYDALVSFTYNLGEGNLKSSTLLKKLNSKDYEGAALEFPKWNRAAGKVLNGLIKRRAAEQKMFMEG